MPQLENGFTQIANEIMEALIKYRIPGEQMQCLLFIIRKTYGWKKKEDAISLSQFVEATGLVKPSICRAINKLKTKNIIFVNKKANKIHATYKFNKIYNTWKALTKKLTINKKANLPLAKKRHTKETTTKERKKIDKRKFLDFVLLTDDEHKNLISKFGKTETLEWIERLNEYIGSKGKKYKSHYFTILSWERKDKKNDRHNI